MSLIFTYLGKKFNYKMDTSEIEQELMEEMAEYLERIDRPPLHPKNKILIVTRYVYSKLRWRLSIYNMSQTWVEQHLDNKVTEYVKKWLHFHQGANVTHLKLATKKIGLGLQLVSDVFRYCKLSIRKILSKCINNDIRTLFNTTKCRNIEIDSLLKSGPEKAKSLLTRQIEDKVTEHLSKLKEQSVILKHTAWASIFTFATEDLERYQ